VFDFMRKSFMVGLGALSISKEKAETIVDDLVKRGEVTSEEAKKLVNDLVKRGEEQKEELTSTIRREMERFRFDIGLATNKDIERLEEKIRHLEERLGSGENS